jgi:hypothetical protein
VIPAAPLLVPALAGGSAHLDEPLRRTVRDAVAWLLAGDEPLVVVGALEGTVTPLDGGAPEDGARSGFVEGTWDWNALGLPLRGGAGAPLPTALGVGAWFVDDVAPERWRRYLGVDPDDPTDACLARGRELVAAGPVRLLVVADGTACRTEKAPGFLNPAAESFDAALSRALARGCPDDLAALDPVEARELLVHGRAGFGVLAGAAGCGAGHREAELDHAGAPYGVHYLVARWGGVMRAP